MAREFRIGDHVSWNSEAGRVSGTIIAVHTRDQRQHRAVLPRAGNVNRGVDLGVRW